MAAATLAREASMKATRPVCRIAAFGALPVLLWCAHSTNAQIAGTRVPGGCDVPVDRRGAETGCYLLATSHG